VLGSGCMIWAGSSCWFFSNIRSYIHISIIARVAPHQLNLEHLMNQMVLLVILDQFLNIIKKINLKVSENTRHGLKRYLKTKWWWQL
jgi:hypothetical protein